MTKRSPIEPLSVCDIGFDTPLLPFSSMEVATDIAERFFNTGMPKGILLVSGAVGVGKTHFLRSWAKIVNFQNDKVYVVNALPRELLDFDFLQYKKKVLVFIFSVEALLRQRDYTIALWKKLLNLDVAILAEAPSDMDISLLKKELGTLLTVADISLPTKRDMALFALHVDSQRNHSKKSELSADFLKNLISNAKSLREIQAALCRSMAGQD